MKIKKTIVESLLGETGMYELEDGRKIIRKGNTESFNNLFYDYEIDDRTLYPPTIQQPSPQQAVALIEQIENAVKEWQGKEYLAPGTKVDLSRAIMEGE